MELISEIISQKNESEFFIILIVKWLMSFGDFKFKWNAFLFYFNSKLYSSGTLTLLLKYYARILSLNHSNYDNGILDQKLYMHFKFF